MDASRAKNPLLVLGVVTLLGTGITFVLADVSVVTRVAQSILPAVVGIVLVGYGWTLDSEMSTFTRRRITKWVLIGVGAFFVVGFWFGQISRMFDTSLGLAIFSSLVTGAALGGTLGVYSARLGRTNRELAEQNERLDAFAGIVSHDLRNPLQTLSGSLELAEETGDPEHFERAHQSADRMDELLENLLILAREQGDAVEREPVSLERVATNCWKTVDTGEAELTVEDDMHLAADESRLRQLLENLVRNAIEHGGRDVTITVGTLQTADGFYVADDGSGLPTTDEGALFETGYSTDTDGTGFGLAIVEQIATDHDWDVRATESNAGGARFEIFDVASIG